MNFAFFLFAAVAFVGRSQTTTSFPSTTGNTCPIINMVMGCCWRECYKTHSCSSQTNCVEKTCVCKEGTTWDPVNRRCTSVCPTTTTTKFYKCGSSLMHEGCCNRVCGVPNKCNDTTTCWVKKCQCKWPLFWDPVNMHCANVCPSTQTLPPQTTTSSPATTATTSATTTANTCPWMMVKSCCSTVCGQIDPTCVESDSCAVKTCQCKGGFFYDPAKKACTAVCPFTTTTSATTTTTSATTTTKPATTSTKQPSTTTFHSSTTKSTPPAVTWHLPIPANLSHVVSLEQFRVLQWALNKLSFSKKDLSSYHNFVHNMTSLVF